MGLLSWVKKGANLIGVSGSGGTTNTNTSNDNDNNQQQPPSQPNNNNEGQYEDGGQSDNNNNNNNNGVGEGSMASNLNSIVTQKDTPVMDFDKDYEGFIQPNLQQLLAIIKDIGPFPNQGEPRHQLAYNSGGKICGDLGQVSKIQSIGKQMLRIIGKKIMSGDFNLTRISFPIKAMVPKTALENSTLSCCTLPYFLNPASQLTIPIERLKLCMTSVISAAYYMNLFLKPLNPIIGQTLEGKYPDGTQVYCEQISHHPPISYFLVIGPHKKWRYYGFYQFAAHAGFNSLTLTNRGWRTFQFHDGQKIWADFSKQVYGGILMGSLRSQAIGSVTFRDVQNGLEAQIKYGKIKKKPSDYFSGTITGKDGKEISQFEGTYCGYINFDGVRVWDGRGMKAIKITLPPTQLTLQSDFRRRSDLQLLKQGRLCQAQKQKQRLQDAQRADFKLRSKNI